jgi:hypothetical protein
MAKFFEGYNISSNITVTDIILIWVDFQFWLILIGLFQWWLAAYIRIKLFNSMYGSAKYEATAFRFVNSSHLYIFFYEGDWWGY